MPDLDQIKQVKQGLRHRRGRLTAAISASVSWASGLLSLPLTIDVAHNRSTRE
jgi:hypothetical protein